MHIVIYNYFYKHIYTQKSNVQYFFKYSFSAFYHKLFAVYI